MTQTLILPHTYEFSMTELEGAIHNAMMITTLNLGLVGEGRVDATIAKINQYYSGRRTIIEHKVINDVWKKDQASFYHTKEFCLGIIDLLAENYDSVMSKVVTVNCDSDPEWLDSIPCAKIHVPFLPFNDIGINYYDTYYVISYDYDRTSRGSLVYVVTVPRVGDDHNHIMACVVSTLDGAHAIHGSVRNLDDMREMARVLRFIGNEEDD